MVLLYFYGVTVWGNASNILLAPIHILQKKFVRMATYNDGDPGQSGPLIHSPPLFSMLNLLTIFDIFKLQVGKIVYESLNCIGPMHNILTYTPASETHNHETRYAAHGRFYIHTVRTQRFGIKNLQNEGRRIWTSLPINIKSCRTKNSFLKNLKDFLISSYI